MFILKGDFTLFLSGVEPVENFNVASSVTKNVLLSYYYIRRRGLAEIEERLKKHRGMKILIDSGAFTFFKDPQYKTKSLEWWETYLKNYTDFVRTHRDYVFACVELDIDSIVGAEQVQEWREKYFYPLEQEGINVIYLYHLDKDLDYYEQLCRQHAYVGFSYLELKRNIEDANEIEALVNTLFDIAKKYRTAIHGFAITGNKMLLKYPFFSADSTTYLAGAQFGEINYFEAGALKHLKKEVWKTQYMVKLQALGLKQKLLENESPYELIKASAIGYKQFEEHIRGAMRAQKYWEGRVNTKFKLPDLEWFATDMKDWQDRLVDAGIDKNVPESVGITILQDLFVIYNNTDQVSSYTLEDLVEVCGLFRATGKNYNTKDKCLKFLKEAIKEHLDGLRTELSDLSSPQEGERTALEREHYIQEKDYIEVELTREECGQLLPALLTAGYDKDSVEKQLIEQGIQPVYDRDGNVLKGIKTVRKDKKIASKSFARLSCDRCATAMNCPEYMAGHICAYDMMFRRFNTRDPEDVMQGMTAIADVAMERAMKAYMQETMMGGVPTKATSSALKDAWEYLAKLKALENEVSGNPLVVSQTKIKGGMIEQTTIKGTNPQQGGLLAQIFMSNEDTIDVTDAEVIG